MLLRLLHYNAQGTPLVSAHTDARVVRYMDRHACSGRGTCCRVGTWKEGCSPCQDLPPTIKCQLVHSSAFFPTASSVYCKACNLLSCC